MFFWKLRATLHNYTRFITEYVIYEVYHLISPWYVFQSCWISSSRTIMPCLLFVCASLIKQPLSSVFHISNVNIQLWMLLLPVSAISQKADAASRQMHPFYLRSCVWRERLCVRKRTTVQFFRQTSQLCCSEVKNCCEWIHEASWTSSSCDNLFSSVWSQLK